MSDREVIYLDINNVVVNIVVIGDADPNSLLDPYGYQSWIDRSEAPTVGMRWTRLANGTWQPPQPYPSWSWDGTSWISPIPVPDDSGTWIWDEETQSWIQVET